MPVSVTNHCNVATNCNIETHVRANSVDGPDDPLQAYISPHGGRGSVVPRAARCDLTGGRLRCCAYRGAARRYGCNGNTSRPKSGGAAQSRGRHPDWRRIHAPFSSSTERAAECSEHHARRRVLLDDQRWSCVQQRRDKLEELCSCGQFGRFEWGCRFH